MAQYCEAGSVARLTLPNGDILDFPAPIEIECKKRDFPDGVRVNITARYSWKFQAASGNIFSREVTTSTSNFSGGVAWTPVGEIRVDFRNNQFFVDVLHPITAGGVPQWVNYGNFTRSAFDYSASIINVVRLFPPTTPPPDEYLLTVNTVGGINLYFGIFDSCGYSVECLQPCPPNTLDCGDCCLDCRTIFNQLSALRAQLVRLK